MRRKVFAITALVALVACGVAFAAASNSYTGTYSAKANGSTKKPVATSMVETLKVIPPASGDRGGYPVTEINTSIAGLKSPYAKYFKVCTASTINNAGNGGGWNDACPKGSEVASGPVEAVLGTPNTLASAGSFECHLGLHVYNAGSGKLTYFLTVANAEACNGLSTGQATAWTGTVKEKGTTLLNDVPEPADVSTNAGGIGLWGSLQTETLKWSKLTVKHDGKTYPFLESIGCKAGKRSYSTKFTANKGGSETVKGTSKC